MKKLLTLILTALAYCPSTAQESYFQQEVNYWIEVALDDSLHQLDGQIKIQYINHSPDVLDTIYLHLWPNAYRNKTTAFAKQQLKDGNTAFYFAEEESLGGIEQLDFHLEAKPVAFTYFQDNPDVAFINLPNPLPSGDTLILTTPFRVKIPESFSRLGHVGQSYQITQWYPKPAVYDRDGWHPMPYLDRGEFYAEFGAFDVKITLPENYVTGATGVLQTLSEHDFLAEKIKETDAYLAAMESSENLNFERFPPSSERLKTIHYTAERVHDFAWFADKRFKVQKSRVELSTDTVDTWVMFTDFESHLWQNAIKYVDRAVQFYSDALGDYPYPQMTAVQSALSAGSGMEYPMITVIGESESPRALDEVITHEVGHNWFYGILANNERDHAWMDEGINTFYEKRYMQQYYSDPSWPLLPEFLQGKQPMENWELTYQLLKRNNVEQASDTPADATTWLNYYFGAYEKPAVALKYLEAYIGKKRFDAAMQRYFQQWQFQHPQPEDFQKVLEKAVGEPLDWLFDGLLFSNDKLDYATVSIEDQGKDWKVNLKNKGRINGPVPLYIHNQDSFSLIQWVKGFPEEQSVILPKGDYNRLLIDAQRITPDYNRNNNSIQTTGQFKTIEPINLSLLPKVDDGQSTPIFLHPAVGWNAYDKWMFGMTIHNLTFPSRPFQFFAVPLLATGTNSFAGIGEAGYHVLPENSFLRKAKIGVNWRRFHHNDLASAQQAFNLQYNRFVPYLAFDFKGHPTFSFRQKLTWRTIFLNTETGSFDNEGAYQGNEKLHNSIHELSYQAENRRALHPFEFLLALEGQQYDLFGQNESYLKASLDWRGHYTYEEDKNVSYRIFLGTFLQNTQRDGGVIIPAAFNLIGQGYNDYRYDEFYLGRNERRGIWSQQISIRDGGMKLPAGPGFDFIGRSNNFIFALNLKADLPGKFPLQLPLKPYFDLGFFDNATPTGQDAAFKDQLVWSGGLELELVQGFFSLYFPIINSENIDNILKEKGNYFSRISFRLALHQIDLLEVLDVL